MATPSASAGAPSTSPTRLPLFVPAGPNERAAGVTFPSHILYVPASFHGPRLASLLFVTSAHPHDPSGPLPVYPPT